MELCAQFGLEIGWDMSFLLELIPAVGIGTGVSELALPVNLKVPAEFSFLLDLVLALELMAFLRILEVLALTLSCCLAIVLVGTCVITSHDWPINLG